MSCFYFGKKMLVKEYTLNDYYHQFLTIEVDELTESLNDVIKIRETDCYVLCSAYCDTDGYLMFNVLAVGSSWENCTRGLKRKQMLGVFEMDQVCDCVARLVDPDYDMLKKNQSFIEMSDFSVDEEIIRMRQDERLDDLRHLCYPDVVVCGFFADQSILEGWMRITGEKGPFLVGMVLEDLEESDVNEGDVVYALPYVEDDEIHLLSLFSGEELNEEQKGELDRIIKELTQAGFSFSGFSVRS